MAGGLEMNPVAGMVAVLLLVVAFFSGLVVVWLGACDGDLLAMAIGVFICIAANEVMDYVEDIINESAP